MRALKICNIFLFIFTFMIIGNFPVFSQCANSYFKPAGYSLFNERVRFSWDYAGDFNNDGILDLIGYGISANGSDNEKVYISLADSQGVFGNLISITPPTTYETNSLKWADFDSDGDLDVILLLESSPKSVLIYKSDGSMNFTAQTPTVINTNETISNVVDINNDSIGDLFTRQTDGQTVTSYYRFGNANGTFGTPVQVVNGSYNLDADFNNDGKVDFPFTSGGSLQILYNQGNGVFFSQPTTVTIGSTLDVKDLNNDDLPDLITADNSPKISVIMNNGNNNFTKTDYPAPVRVGGGLQPRPNPYFGDFDGDGFLDMMIEYDRKPYYSIYKNNGSGGFSRTDYNVKALGLPFDDFDGDDKTDLIRTDIQFQSSNKLINQRNLIVAKNTCIIPGATKLVDFDSNGKTDFNLWNESQGIWKSRYLNQNDGTQQDIYFNWGTVGDIPAPGDFDGDGATDYAVFRPSNGVWYIWQSSDGAVQFINFGLNGDIPVASDFDGDDKTDIAVFRPSEGNWYILKSSNQQFYGIHWGISEDKAVPADFDGDGQADIAVYRPSTGVWYVFRSSDNGFYAVQWGISEDNPLPADYDGDGKADLTVHRPSNNVWYILRSYNNEFFGYTFGTTGDIPQPGDYDGDGIFDIGIYRPSTKTWYLSTNNEGVLFGDTGDSPLGSLSKLY